MVETRHFWYLAYISLTLYSWLWTCCAMNLESCSVWFLILIFNFITVPHWSPSKLEIFDFCPCSIWVCSDFFLHGLNNGRGNQRRFPRLFFISYVKDQGGKRQNLIKCLGKVKVSHILLVCYVRLAGGARAEKLGVWSPFSFLMSKRLMNVPRYFFFGRLLITIVIEDEHSWRTFWGLYLGPLHSLC